MVRVKLAYIIDWELYNSRQASLNSLSTTKFIKLILGIIQPLSVSFDYPTYDLTIFWWFS